MKPCVLLRRLRFATILLATVTLLAACVTSVDEIRSDPQHYRERTVVLRGRVVESIGVPFVDQAISLFEDETGRAIVVSKEPFASDVELSLRGRVVAFPEERTKESVAEAAGNLAEVLVETGFADTEKAARIATTLIEVASRFAERLGGLFFLVHAP
jgi:hypothetical protein